MIPAAVDDGPLQVGSTFLGKYQVLDAIGRGGHGTVYHAVHLFMGAPVALKVLRVLTEEMRHRGQLEAGLLARLDHPNVVRVHDAGVSEHEQLYIVMEFLRGSTLAERLKRQGAVDVAEGLDWFAAVCDGLAVAHKGNAIHRDLKPLNIFITEENVPKILDFGIAKIVGGTGYRTEQNKVLGTCLYMSPEQIQGQNATQRSDIYSLGLVMYEALSGRHPFLVLDPMLNVRDQRRVTWYHLKKLPPRLDEVVPEVPSYVAQLVQTCLAKRPGDRSPSAGVLAGQLRECRDKYLKDARRSARRLMGKPDEVQSRQREDRDGRLSVDSSAATARYRETVRLYSEPAKALATPVPLVADPASESVAARIGPLASPIPPEHEPPATPDTAIDRKSPAPKVDPVRTLERPASQRRSAPPVPHAVKAVPGRTRSAPPRALPNSAIPLKTLVLVLVSSSLFGLGLGYLVMKPRVSASKSKSSSVAESMQQEAVRSSLVQSPPPPPPPPTPQEPPSTVERAAEPPPTAAPAAAPSVAPRPAASTRPPSASPKTSVAPRKSQEKAKPATSATNEPWFGSKRSTENWLK